MSPCLFNFYAEYIIRNAGLDDSQAGMKIARRNINNLKYADDTTLMAESEEELKSLLMKVKEESEKVGLREASVQFSSVAQSCLTLCDPYTRPLFLSLEKSVCRLRSNSLKQTWNNRLVQNWERSTTRLYIVAMLI